MNIAIKREEISVTTIRDGNESPNIGNNING